MSFVQVRGIDVERAAFVRHDLHAGAERGRVAPQSQPELFPVAVERDAHVRLVARRAPPAAVVLLGHLVRVVVERLVVQDVLVQALACQQSSLDYISLAPPPSES